MSWIAEYDTQGREFPTCVHVTKTIGTMTHGATYVPIEDGKAVRAENDKLRELVRGLHMAYVGMVERYRSSEEGLIWEYSGSIEEDGMKLRQECDEERHRFDAAMRELGIEVDE